MLKKNYFVCVVFIIATKTFASNVKQFQENFYLVSSACSNVVVNMNSGELIGKQASDYIASCTINDGNSMNCVIAHGGVKDVPRKFDSGMVGAEAALTHQTAESMIINMVSRKFTSRTSVNAENRRIRGHKICGGVFLYESEYKKLSIQKKNSQI